MKLSRIRRLYRLFSKKVLEGRTDGEALPFTPSKTLPCDAPYLRYFPRKAPEKYGISSSHVTDFLHALEKGQRVHLHRIALLCDGAVIAEAAHPAYRGRHGWHACYSMTKSIVALAVGILWGEGKLSPSDSVASLLCLEKPGKWKSLTLSHLLTMTSGASFSDLFTVVDADWQAAFFDGAPISPPGEKFFYNSVNSYIIGRIIEKVSGMPAGDFIAERVFRPLSIDSYFFESDKEGHTKCGWGLYLTLEDMLKLGLLFVNGGSFEGVQVVPAEWICQMQTAHRQTNPALGAYDYGYQMWVCREDDSLLFNGMFGQNIWMRPKEGLVIATQSGNAEILQQSELLDLLAEYFGKDFTRASRLRKNRRAHRALKRTAASFFDRRENMPTPPPLWRRLFRKPTLPAETTPFLGSYDITPNAAGLLPAVLRLIQNNHTEGISELAFAAEGRRLLMRVTEGAVTRQLPVGLDGYLYTEQGFGGEIYTVGARGAFLGDTLLIDLFFTELPYVFRISVKRTEDGISFTLREEPGTSLGQKLLGTVLDQYSRAFNTVGRILPSLRSENLNAAATRFFSPTLTGIQKPTEHRP